MHTFHLHSHPHGHHFKELKLLFSSLSLQAFAFGMVNVFLPIFFLVRGLDMADVALYFVFRSALQVVLHDITLFFIGFSGVKHVLVASYALTLISFIIFGMSDLSPHAILLGFAINAIGQTFYWDARHVQSTVVIPKRTRGKSNSLLFILIMIGSALGPLIGGLIGEKYGLIATFLSAAVLMAFAALPLLVSPDRFMKFDKTRRSSKIPPRIYAANSALNIEVDVAIYIWPVFIFLLIENYAALGLIFSAGIILALLLARISGNLTDRGYGSTVLGLSATARSIVHGMRLLAVGVPSAFLVNFAGELASAFKSPTYTSFYYANARKYGVLRFVRNLEIAACFTAMMFWLSVYVLLQFLSFEQMAICMFIIAVLASPLQWLIADRPR